MSGDRAAKSTGPHVAIDRAAMTSGPHVVIDRAAESPGPHVVIEANPHGIAERIASILSPFPEGRPDREAGE